MRPTTLLFTSIFLVMNFANRAFPTEKPRSGLIADLVHWDDSRGSESVRKNVDLFSEVSPNWYSINKDGEVETLLSEEGVPLANPDFSAFLRLHGVKVIPLIGLNVGTTFNVKALRKILHDDKLRAGHIKKLVSIAVDHKYDGLDIDYEELKASDREYLTAFLQDLAAALHRAGKTMAVDVYPKEMEFDVEEDWEPPRSQDLGAIAKVADQVRLMNYNFSYEGGPPGPLAPVDWAERTIQFALKVVPANKLIQGLPLYGCDWGKKRGTFMGWEELNAIASRSKKHIGYDHQSQSALFRYKSGKTAHKVWLETAASTIAKIKLSEKYKLGGTFFWSVGGEDPDTWSAIRQHNQPLPGP